ncbi:hypothetical protein E1287_33940 [Actinomadura sp. KC06]|uniref:hypothetical protein n=1 Tax=Actinomadura sp. KC06 TaxID=2530369 RepID=UPI00104DA0DD|nr:hypothetical protein [Actinomadura sp. KC06]TDD27784.1 hypothetical protein E1287_33940 [Actinomadura sp. KC06]
MRLPSAAELLAAAQESYLHTMVRAQIDWVRAGREVDADGRPADCPAYLETIGKHLAQDPETTDGALRFWDVMVRTGVLHVDASRSLAWPGPGAIALKGGDAQSAVGAWRDFLIEYLVACGEKAEDDPDVPKECPGITFIVDLYAHGGPVPVDRLASNLDAGAPTIIELHSNALIHAGLVERRGPLVGVTPLGKLVCHTLLQEATGMTIPVLGCYADADAVTLLNALAAYRMEHIGDEAQGWVHARSVEAGVAEIVAALHEVGPFARRAGLDLLAGTFGAQFGQEGRNALVSLTADPKLGALAHGLLTPEEKRQVDEPSRAATMWALVDLAEMSAATRPFPEMLQECGYVGQPADKMPKLVDGLADTEHPWAVHLLDAMIAHHPEAVVVEAARTARRRLPGPEREPA